MKLQRAHLLVIALCMALTPVHAELDKRQRSRGKKETGSVRLQLMGQLPVNVDIPPNTTRGGNNTIYVAPPPTGNNATGDGTAVAPYSTIQFAFVQAISGDEIRVMPGTYNECVNNTAFALGTQKNLNIVADDFAVNGVRTSTILDGTGQCVFPFSVVNLAGSGAGSRLEGFTITGAAASGVFVLGSGVVTNNVISNNTSLEGGGVYAYSATCFYGTTGIFVTDNQITNNTADDEGRCDVDFNICTSDANCGPSQTCLFRGGDGGGVFVRGDVVNPISGGCLGGDGRITVESNVIDGNGADFAFGGGLFVRANAESLQTATVTVTQNLISNNSTLPFSFGYGGGIWMGTYGNGTSVIDFVNNTVTSNISTGDGGGLSAWIDATVDGHHTINVTANDVQSNIAEGSGGGMDLFVFALDLLDTNEAALLNAGGNLIVNNQAQGVAPSFYPGIGGGISGNIWSQRSNAAMELNVFENDVRGNTATLAGGGIGAISIADADPADDPMARGPALTVLSVHNNLVAANLATDGATATTAVGGGIYAYAEGLGGISLTEPSQSQVFLTFNTVAQNVSDTGAGGIEMEAYTELDTNGDDAEAIIKVEHSIVYDNSGFGVGGAEPPLAGVLLSSGLAPVSDQGTCVTATCGTGVLSLTPTRNSMFMNGGGDFEGWVGMAAFNNMFTDPLLDLTFTPSQCSDTIDAGNPLVSAALEPAPNGPFNPATMMRESIVNLGHTGGTAAAVRTLGDTNGDGFIDGVDVLRLSVAFGTDNGSGARWDPSVDMDGDNFISGVDLAIMAAQFALSCTP